MFLAEIAHNHNVAPAADVIVLSSFSRSVSYFSLQFSGRSPSALFTRTENYSGLMGLLLAYL